VLTAPMVSALVARARLLRSSVANSVFIAKSLG
jgi:hypothetical protein